MEDKLSIGLKDEDENETKERLIRELADYERRFTSMLTNVKLCSVMLDREGRILFINNYLLEITGYTLDEVVQKDYVNTFIPPDKREQMRNIYQMMVNGFSEVLCYIEYEVVTKSDVRIMIGWNNTLLKDVKNNIIGTSSIGEELEKKRENHTLTTVLSRPSVEEVPKLVITGNNFTGETIGDYILVKSLGGDNSNVKLAVHRNTREKVAVKTLKKETMSEQELERARREIDIMKKLTEVGNPYIIRLLDVIETPTEFNIFVEYISGGELVAFILKNKGLSESHTHKLFSQVLSAIECCHKHNIIHRDIKLQNILLDEHKNIKLIDFGLSNFMEEGVFRSTFCGTPAYASPEILLGTKYTGPEVDLWSLGVVLYSMLTAEFPFTTIGDILKGKFKEPEGITEECIDLLKRVLKVEKDDRETLQGVLTHPWVLMAQEEVEAKSAQLKEKLAKRKAELGGKSDGGEEVEEPSAKRRRQTQSELGTGKVG